MSNILFSRGSSWPRDQTQISCIAGRFLTVWATREAQGHGTDDKKKQNKKKKKKKTEQKRNLFLSYRITKEM